MGFEMLFGLGLAVGFGMLSWDLADGELWNAILGVGLRS